MVTMNDVAAQAGVAQSTVSYILNDRHEQRGISPDTRQRVLDIARELGYRRNRLAHAMVTGTNPMFGLLARSPEIEQAGYMLVGALSEAEKRGFSLKMLSYEGPKSLDAVVDRCLELRLAGLIALHLPSDFIAGLAQSLAGEMSLAVLDSSFSFDAGIRVISDDTPGIDAAIDHLVGLGHRHIGMLTVNGDGAAHGRQQAFLAALKRHNLPNCPELVADCRDYWNRERVEAATERLLDSEPAPTALVAVGDSIAMMAMRVIRRRHLRVPEDISMIGFSDLLMARHADPPLTTVAQPFRQMGATAVQFLVENIECQKRGEFVVHREQLLPTQLVIRESCAPITPSAKS